MSTGPSKPASGRDEKYLIITVVNDSAERLL
jgi:hypothetical protein